MASGKSPWKILNRFLSKKDTNKTIKQIAVNNSILTDKLDIANSFSNYFTNIISDLGQSKSNDPTKLDLNCYYSHHIFKPIDLATFIKSSKQIKLSNFNESFNSIPSEIFKLFYQYFSSILTYYFNNLIGNNIYPNCLKISKILPKHKAGPKNILGNYRPISMLSSINKIFERNLYNQLIEYINDKKILHPNQFGFRKKHSTEMALNLLLKHTTEKN